jgi:hypothetical protein
MPEPNGFFPGIDPRDFKDFEDFDFGNIDYSKLSNDSTKHDASSSSTSSNSSTHLHTTTSRIETPQMGGRSKFDFSNLGNFNLR